MVYRITSSPTVTEQEREPSLFENITSTASRLPAVTAAGAGAGLGGAISSPAQFFNLLSQGTMALAGQKGAPYEETPVSKIFPTGEQHLQAIHKQFASTKPRNKVEQFAQDLAKDTLELFTPGQLFKFGKYALTPLRSLGISLAGNTAGAGVEKYTGDKSKGDMAKSGLMLFMSLWNPQTANGIRNELYKKADSILPQGAQVNSSNMMNKLNTLSNKILKGRPKGNLSPSEKFVLEEIDKFRALDNSGNLDMSSLIAQKRSLNESLSKAVYDLPDRTTRARAKELATGILGIAKDTMEEYGLHNPRWLQAQKSADQAASAIYKSNFISKNLEKVMKGKSDGLSHLFGIGVPFAGAFISAPGAVAGATGYLTAKYLTRMYKSPALRNHYAKVIGTAAASNPNEKKLKKEVDDFEKKLNKSESGRFRIKK